MDKKDLKRLCQLSLVEIDENKEEKILSDLEKILSYFSEIEKVETGNLPPSFNGHFEEILGEFREKEKRIIMEEKYFPDEENGYLKGPKIL